MMKFLLTLLSLSVSVSSHGFVQQIWLGDTLVDAWNPYKDPGKKPVPQKLTRVFNDNGPVTDGLFTVSLLGSGAEGSDKI